MNQKHETFVALVAISSESGEAVAKAYVGAGYKAKSLDVARSAGLRKEHGLFVDRSDTTHRYATPSEFIDNATPEEIRAELARLMARKAAKAGSKVVN